jgi:hypothetical protein
MRLFGLGTGTRAFLILAACSTNAMQYVPQTSNYSHPETHPAVRLARIAENKLHHFITSEPSLHHGINNNTPWCTQQQAIDAQPTLA